MAYLVDDGWDSQEFETLAEAEEYAKNCLNTPGDYVHIDELKPLKYAEILPDGSLFIEESKPRP